MRIENRIGIALATGHLFLVWWVIFYISHHIDAQWQLTWIPLTLLDLPVSIVYFLILHWDIIVTCRTTIIDFAENRSYDFWHVAGLNRYFVAYMIILRGWGA